MPEWKKIEPDNWKNEHGYQIEGQTLQGGGFRYRCYYPKYNHWPWIGYGPAFDNDPERARRWCAWHHDKVKTKCS